MDETPTNELIKQGETIAQVSMRHTKTGLLIICRAHRVIEDLFIKWSTGLPPEDVNVFGRQWIPVDDQGQPTNQPLMVHSLALNPGLMKFEKCSVRVDIPGQRLYFPEKESEQENGITNLSFLRLVGISTAPVSFELRGSIYSLNVIRNTGKKITEGLKGFYTARVMPVDFTITMSTQEKHL